jgi:hypothetical protein
MISDVAATSDAMNRNVVRGKDIFLIAATSQRKHRRVLKQKKRVLALPSITLHQQVFLEPKRPRIFDKTKITANERHCN